MKKKKLLVQVGALIAVFFAVILIAGGFIIYAGSTTMYLSAKNEMIDRDLLRVRDFVENVPGLSSLLDYWRENPYDTIREMTEEERDKGYDVYIGEDWYYMSDETFARIDDYQKLAVAHDYYSYFAGGFDGEQHDFGYEAIYCIDIRPENAGFIYAKGDGEYTFKYDSFGLTLDMDISGQRAVQKILLGTNKTTEYEIVDNYNGKSIYIGYVPITVNGTVKCAVCIFYDWSEFQKSMSENLTVMTLIGLAVMLIVFAALLHYLYNIALKPVTQIQSNVREYRENKDSKQITENMKHIRSKNEFGVLADDISELAEEMERFTAENIRLAGEQERVAAELEFATRIQSGSLPSEFPAFPERSEFDLYASMTPAKEVGGDFYDLFLIDDDHLALVIADVSGKGVPASLFMMSSMILIHDRALMGGKPSEVLEFVNERICSKNPSEMFVTVWLGILEISTGRLSCANAGHEYPVLGTNGGFKLYKDKHGFVLGGADGMKYKTYDIQLCKGDIVFVYTDGAAEATNASDELFGTDRLTEALNALPDGSPEELIAAVGKAVNGFVGDAPQFDDLTMLCLKYNGDPV